MNSSLELQAVVVSTDPQVIDVLNSCLRNIGIQPNVHHEIASANQAMSRNKIDTFFVDRELDSELLVLSTMRSSPSSRKALGFAIVPPQHSRGNHRVADFVLEKPLAPMRLNQTLRAAYGMMVKERLRYSRHALQTEATVVDSLNHTFSATTTNVSQTGIALQSAGQLIAGETVQIQFRLPDTQEKLKCTGQIIWKDEQGRAGLAFQEIDAGARQRLNYWIEAQFIGGRYAALGSGPRSVAYSAIGMSAVSNQSLPV
jgi:hypothetical protein